LVLIPNGEFLTGSPESDSDAEDHEKPQHQTTLSRPFYLSIYEVTQEEYGTVMGVDPSHFKGESHRPVDSVSWYDAIGFCNNLSEKENIIPYYKIDGQDVSIGGGDGYRLPTEAEWEYACRAGTMARWTCGENESDLERFAWYARNSNGLSYPVGEKEPNAWGLYDMHANVAEWCWDRFSGDYYRDSPDEDPTGPSSGSSRALRGGCWNAQPPGVRCSYRDARPPSMRGNLVVGFRVARTWLYEPNDLSKLKKSSSAAEAQPNTRGIR